jgi:hypothetical protein
MNKAMLYIRDNEQCNRIVMTHVADAEDDVMAELRKNAELLSVIYPKYIIDVTLVGNAVVGISAVHTPLGAVSLSLSCALP